MTAGTTFQLDFFGVRSRMQRLRAGLDWQNCCGFH
jgi:hypothetical protein